MHQFILGFLLGGARLALIDSAAREDSTSHDVFYAAISAESDLLWALNLNIRH